MKPRRVIIVAASLLWPHLASADRGSIPFVSDAQIFEPDQKALIGWNGSVELLLLSTDMRASSPTRIVQVLPLPAKPRVTKGSLRSFKRAVAIINRHLNPPRPKKRRRKTRSADLADPFGAAPPARIAFEKRIGSHQIAAVEVLDGARFTSWTQGYLRKNGGAKAKISKQFLALIEQYLQDRYRWFVFDIVSLGPKRRTLAPLLYRFNSTSLYYPMRIARLERGKTSISLLTLTSRDLSTFDGLSVGQAGRRRTHSIGNPFEKRAPSPRGQVKVGATKILEGRTQKAGLVRKLRMYVRRAKVCYERALRTEDLEGKLRITWAIGIQGRVLAADLSDSTINDPQMEQCLREAAFRQRFERPRNKVTFEARLSFRVSGKKASSPAPTASCNWSVDPFRISGRSAQRIGAPFARLLRGQRARLGLIECFGELSAFDKDLLAR